jgi:hypothetical protein
MPDPRTRQLPPVLVTESEERAVRARARGGSVAAVIRAALQQYLGTDWPRRGGPQVQPGTDLLS